MPVPAHRRITYSGIFGTVLAPYERWAFRLNISPDTDGPGLEAFATAGLAAFTTHLAPWVAAAARLTEVKTASIAAGTAEQPGGAYATDPYVLATDTPGGAANMPNPPQIALAVSLNTDRRGASGRGRFFLPAPAVSFTPANGLVSAAVAQQVADAAGAFISALNAFDGALSNVAIVSTKGFTSPVTSVRVGRVLDTIRSRRTSLDEGYGANVVNTLG